MNWEAVSGLSTAFTGVDRNYGVGGAARSAGRRRSCERDAGSTRVMTTWRPLEEVIAIHREVAGPFWMNFEQLYNDSRKEHQVSRLERTRG